MGKCIDCKIKIGKTAKRCTQCHLKKLNHLQCGIRHPNYIDGRTKAKHYCIECNIKISYASFRYGSKMCHSCSSKKNPKQYSTAFGDKNINWRGGISKAPYPFIFTPELKRAISKRDKCKCRGCGKDEKSNYRKLDVHHIDYNKQNCTKENLITLCKKCHSVSNFNRDYWYAYFTYIIGG